MIPPRIVTPERAEEIEARLAKATPGPWTVSWAEGDWCEACREAEERTLKCPDCEIYQGAGVNEIFTIDAGDYNTMDDNDAEFIAHAPDDLRDLLHTLAVEREERRVAEGEAMLLVESAEYKLGRALEENARLRGLFTEDSRHAANEVFASGTIYRRFYRVEEGDYLAALAPRGEGKDGL